MNSKFDITDLEVCVVCLHLLANGEYNDGTDAADIAQSGIARLWGDDARHLVPGDNELGFSTRPCEACGNPLHGDRHEAHLVKPTSRDTS